MRVPGLQRDFLGLRPFARQGRQPDSHRVPRAQLAAPPRRHTDGPLAPPGAARAACGFKPALPRKRKISAGDVASNRQAAHRFEEQDAVRAVDTAVVRAAIDGCDSP